MVLKSRMLGSRLGADYEEIQDFKLWNAANRIELAGDFVRVYMQGLWPLIMVIHREKN